MAKIVFPSRIPLLTSKTFFSIAATVIIVPIAYGALTGYMLGVSAIAFFALIALSIPGGFVAGCEHDKVAHGAIRGLIGSSFFGAGLLGMQAITGAPPKAHMLPLAYFALVNGAAGILLGLLGAWSRARATRTHLSAG